MSDSDAVSYRSPEFPASRGSANERAQFVEMREINVYLTGESEANGQRWIERTMKAAEAKTRRKVDAGAPQEEGDWRQREREREQTERRKEKNNETEERKRKRTDKRRRRDGG